MMGIGTIAHQIVGYRVKPKAEVLQELFSDLLVRSEREGSLRAAFLRIRH